MSLKCDLTLYFIIWHGTTRTRLTHVDITYQHEVSRWRNNILDLILIYLYICIFVYEYVGFWGWIIYRNKVDLEGSGITWKIMLKTACFVNIVRDSSVLYLFQHVFTLFHTIVWKVLKTDENGWLMNGWYIIV